jgi:hypothetical protein
MKIGNPLCGLNLRLWGINPLLNQIWRRIEVKPRHNMGEFMDEDRVIMLQPLYDELRSKCCDN